MRRSARAPPSPGRAVAAADQRAGDQRDAERGGAAHRRSREAAALGADEPRQAGGATDRGDVEVQAQPEDVVGGVDAQELLEDAKARVAGDVEREQPGGANLAAAAEPDQRRGESEVEDELVEERGVEGGVALVAVGAVRGVDAQR